MNTPVRTLNARVGWHQSSPQSGELRIFGPQMPFGVGDPESSSAPMTQDQLAELVALLMQSYLEWPEQERAAPEPVTVLVRRFEATLRAAGYT
jgi:hypothetical protein